MHTRAVTRGVYREHLTAPSPHRLTLAGAFLAPVECGADRSSRTYRIKRRSDAVGNTAGPGPGHRYRQPRNPADQFDIGVEVQPGDNGVPEGVGRSGQCRFAPFGRQWPDFAQRTDRARDIQRRHQTQLGDRHTGCARDDLAIAGPVVAAGPERVDWQ